VSGPVRRRDLLGPAVSKAFEAVPVARPVPLERIAVTAGMRPDAMEAALAALQSAGLVENRDGGWCMTKAGRDERRGGAVDAAEELPLGWW
jgi:DNA-binding IscR family transcriptional regulator